MNYLIVYWFIFNNLKLKVQMDDFVFGMLVYNIESLLPTSENCTYRPMCIMSR